MDSQRTFTQEQARAMYKALSKIAWENWGFDIAAPSIWQSVARKNLAAIDTATETPPAQRYVVEVDRPGETWFVVDNDDNDVQSIHDTEWRAEAEAKRLNGEGGQ